MTHLTPLLASWAGREQKYFSQLQPASCLTSAKPSRVQKCIPLLDQHTLFAMRKGMLTSKTLFRIRQLGTRIELTCRSILQVPLYVWSNSWATDHEICTVGFCTRMQQVVTLRCKPRRAANIVTSRALTLWKRFEDQTVFTTADLQEIGRNHSGATVPR